MTTALQVGTIDPQDRLLSAHTNTFHTNAFMTLVHMNNQLCTEDFGLVRIAEHEKVKARDSPGKHRLLMEFAVLGNCKRESSLLFPNSEYYDRSAFALLICHPFRVL